MAVYEMGDVVTYYFVVFANDENKSIKGWSDNKELVKFYMEFHNCEDMVLKSITKRIEEIVKITEENCHDEIRIYNITIRNRGKRKKGEPATIVSIPATRTESTFITEEANTFLTSNIRYSFLNSAIPYLKGKYRDALDNIFLTDVINKTCNNRDSPITEKVEMDQLILLFKSFPETFGK